MKKFLAIIVLAAVLAVSGCNNGGGAGETSSPASTTKKEGGKKTLVAYEAEDTTEDALLFIKEKSPLFYNYLQKRMRAPLTMITTNTIDGKELTYGIYVKNGQCAAIYSDNADGTRTVVIYEGDKAYQLETGDKAVYVINYGEENVKNSVEQCLIRIDIADAMNSTYTKGVENIDGKDYNYEAVELDGRTSYFYFENGSNEISYTKSNDVLTKITEFKNEITNTDIFVIPDDYERLTSEDLAKRYAAN